MTKFLSWLRRATALAVLVMALLLCWQCVDIYLSGTCNDALAMTPIFRSEDIALRMRALAVPLTVCAVVIAVSILSQRLGASPKAHTTSVLRDRCKDHKIVMNEKLPSVEKGLSRERRSMRFVRVLLYTIAAAFIVLGVMNGGLHDVLVKATNICTECIGLG